MIINIIMIIVIVIIYRLDIMWYIMICKYIYDMIWMEVDFTRQTIPTNTNTPNLSKIMATYMSHKMVVAIYIYILRKFSWLDPGHFGQLVRPGVSSRKRWNSI